MSDSEFSDDKKPLRSGPRDRSDFQYGKEQGEGDQPDSEYSGRRSGGRKVFFKRKVCRFCKGIAKLDYKDGDSLRKFITERGKIVPGRITGTCARHQRRLAKTIKQARALALLPFVERYR